MIESTNVVKQFTFTISLDEAKIVKISGELIFHSKIEYPKLQIPRKTKNSVFEQISGFPPPLDERQQQ